MKMTNRATWLKILFALSSGVDMASEYLLFINILLLV